MEFARAAAAKSRSSWVCESFQASVATGDHQFSASAGAAEEALCAKIDDLCALAPTMEDIIAVIQGLGFRVLGSGFTA